MRGRDSPLMYGKKGINNKVPGQQLIKIEMYHDDDAYLILS